MFKKILALVLATMMVLGGMVTVSAAEETAAAEEVVYDYTAAAEYLAALDILKGQLDGNTIDFALENGVTRLQMALFIARIMTGETNDQYWSKVNDNTTPYDDVVNYFGAVSFADENGIIKGKGWIPGIGDNCFDPNGAITFQDAITMAVRALGYKQLQYPQGFIQVGIELGLNADLETLDNEAELTRGQMIQILKNMLLVKVDGAASFAEQNFGLVNETYVIVATNLQAMPEATRVAKDGYVALAKLNADGTYDYKNYIHVTLDELGLTADSTDAANYVELKLGYSYTVSSYDNFATAEFVANATETFQNYGDVKQEITAGTAFNAINSDKYVKIGGVNYELVSSYTNLYNKTTSKSNNDAELIVHSMFDSSKKTAFQYYVYDIKGNIMAADGVTVGLYLINGTYYKKLSGVDAANFTDYTFRVATEEDFAACAINMVGASADMYGVVTNNDDMTGNNVALKNGAIFGAPGIDFSEITLIDDNNDGTYDRGIYVPYSVGKYGQYTTNNYRWTVANSAKDSAKSKAAAPRINDVDLYIYTTDIYGQTITVSPSANSAYVRETDINYVNNKPAKDEYIVYYYNPYARMLVVIENLGKGTTGVMTNMTVGSYTYDKFAADGSAYYYKDSSLVVDGTTYKLGYRPYSVNTQFGTAINGDINNYGYDKVLTTILQNGNYLKLKYLVLADRIILVDDSGASYTWLAFDYGYAKKDTSKGYTSYAYEGMIQGVDEDGYIEVKGYKSDSSAPQFVKINEINGYNYGMLVADYAALQYQYSGIGILQSSGSFETMKKIVMMSFFESLTADLNLAGTVDSDRDGYADASNQRQLMYIINNTNEDGSVNIYTDINLYWAAYDQWRQPKPWVYSVTGTLSDRIKSKEPTSASITFQYGVSTQAIQNGGNKTDDKNYVLTMDNTSVIVVVAKDGIRTISGVPQNGLTLNSTNAAYYSLKNNYIVIASRDKLSTELVTLANGEVAWDDEVNANKYTYYMVIGDTKNDNFEANTSVSIEWNGVTPVYNYKNLYNLNTGNLEPLAVKGGLEGYNDTAWNINAVKPIGAIYRVNQAGEITLMTTDIKTAKSSDIGTDYLGLGTYKYAADSEAVLRAALVELYGAKYGTIKSNAATDHQLNLNSGVIYENFAIKLDSIRLYYTTITNATTGVSTAALSKVTLWDNVASNYKDDDRVKKGDLYCDYDVNDSFFGIVVSTSGTSQGTLDQNAAAALKNAAIETAMSKLEALLVGVDTTIKCACTADHTLADHLASYEDWYAAMADAAAVTAASPDDVEWFGRLVEEAVEAKTNADKAEQATKVGVVKVTANVATLQNVAGVAADGIKIYVDNNNGFGTEYAYQYGSFTAEADGSYTATFKTADGVTAKATWVNNGTNVTLTFAKKSVSGVELDMFTAGTTYRFVINASTGAGAYNVTAE